MICEKCNAEMTYFKNGHSQGWTCPDCGNGIVTSFIDDMQMDETVYTVLLLPNENPSISALKEISNVSGLNILNSRKLANEGGKISKGKANKVANAIKLLKSVGLLYTISPDYPYDT